MMESLRPSLASLKTQGNDLYAQGKYVEAVEAWKRALTVALKESMRGATHELIDTQTKLRLNIAQGLIKYEDYVLAKEHLLIVLDREPENSKALYRLSLVYQGLQDFEKAVGIARRAIKLYPDDASFKVLHNRLVTEEVEARRRSAGQEPPMRLSGYSDDRVAELEPCAGLLSDTEVAISSRDAIGKLIAWKCKLEYTEHPTEADKLKHVDDDYDDWADTMRWRSSYTAERLRDDRTVVSHALPFSILFAIERLLLGEKAAVCDCIFDSIGDSKPSYKLPDLSALSPPCVDLGVKERHEILSKLNGAGSNLRPLTIHILNARGDDEMETRWCSLLERLPGVQKLQLILVGFNQPDDPYCNSIKNPDYLSPQLAKAVSGSKRKVICRLYKGTYTEFLKSASVGRATGKPTGETLLTDVTHPFKPDFVVFPQCNLSRHFRDLVPSIALLSKASIPMLFLGQSVCERPSHSALQLPPVLKKLESICLTQLYWNPFMICVRPTEQCPAMSVRLEDGTYLENYKGISAKYAIAIWAKGHSSERVIELASGDAGPVTALQAELRDAGCDVDCEERALNQLSESEEYRSAARLILDEQEAEVAAKTQALSELLETKMSDLSPTK